MSAGDSGYLYAMRGVGKSWFGIDLGHALAEGRPFGPWQISVEHKVLYVDGEMQPDDIQRRDRALSSGSQNFFYLNHQLFFDLTGQVMNIADLLFQEALFQVCVDGKYEIIFLDNLSTLVYGVDENKGLDWEQIQPWMMRLRRAQIATLWLAHAGRSGEYMRGHSKREDPAIFLIRLDPYDDIDQEPGAHFYVRFQKARQATKLPLPYEFHYKPNGSRTELYYQEAGYLHLLVRLVHEGLSSNREIAEELGISAGYVSKLAKKAASEGLIQIKEGKYYPADEPRTQKEKKSAK
jgi:putative DNA primase/helicase